MVGDGYYGDQEMVCNNNPEVPKTTDSGATETVTKEYETTEPETTEPECKEPVAKPYPDEKEGETPAYPPNAPNIDLHVKDFSKIYHEKKCLELEKKLKAKNGGELPESYKREDVKQFVFDYGQFVAQKYKKAKEKKGKTCTQADLDRVARLVNDAVTKHQ